MRNKAQGPLRILEQCTADYIIENLMQDFFLYKGLKIMGEKSNKIKISYITH